MTATTAPRAGMSPGFIGRLSTRPARVRHLESQATFTPYFALHGDDASRLTYLAELTLEGDAALKLPAGLPVQARPDAAAGAPVK